MNFEGIHNWLPTEYDVELTEEALDDAWQVCWFIPAGSGHYLYTTDPVYREVLCWVTAVQYLLGWTS